jgi:DNA-binding phage protein
MSYKDAMKRKASTSTMKPQFANCAKSPEFAAEYLRAALEDADESRVLLIALARVGRTLLSDVFPL